MQETKSYEPTAADVKQVAISMGMPEKTENQRRAELRSFEADLVNSTLSDDDLESIHSRSYDRGVLQNTKRNIGRKVVAGLVLSGAALLGTTEAGQESVKFVANQAHELVTNQDDTVQPVEPGSPDAGIYNAKVGDTASSIALQVEANIDGVAGNQEHRELQTDIYKQAGSDGLMPGEDIVVPAAADTDPNEPDVQL